MQIIGNLIYYRYINSAIVAPDAFDIIDVGVVKGLTNDQRRNLGSVAKILQFAASNKGVSCNAVLTRNLSSHMTCSPTPAAVAYSHSSHLQLYDCDLTFNLLTYWSMHA